MSNFHPSESLTAVALRIAASQLGVTEQPKGSNSGPEVNSYLASVGLKPGYSWCMAFVYWCYEKASKEQDLPNPLVKTGGVLAQWNRTRLRKITNREAIQPGDIFIMDYGAGNGHTGIVTGVSGSVIKTIEGNTNIDGSREGYKVCARSRSITTIKGFIRV